MGYGMRGRTQLSVGQEWWTKPTDAAGPLSQRDACRGSSAGMEAVSAARQPVVECEGGMRIPAYDEEFYEIFSEIRLS